MPVLAAAVKDTSFYTALRNEIETDPMNYGYAAFRTSGADNSLADALNLVRATVTINKYSMNFNDFTHAMISQLQTLSTAQGTQMQILGAAGTIYIGETATRTYLENVYSTTAAKNQLQALYTRTGSRAEFLWGDGTSIDLTDIVTAKFLNNATGW
jgi:hypothetical protein